MLTSQPPCRYFLTAFLGQPGATDGATLSVQTNTAAMSMSQNNSMLESQRTMSGYTNAMDPESQTAAIGQVRARRVLLVISSCPKLAWSPRTCLCRLVKDMLLQKELSLLQPIRKATPERDGCRAGAAAPRREHLLQGERKDAGGDL